MKQDHQSWSVHLSTGDKVYIRGLAAVKFLSPDRVNRRKKKSLTRERVKA